MSHGQDSLDRRTDAGGSSASGQRAGEAGPAGGAPVRYTAPLERLLQRAAWIAVGNADSAQASFSAVLLALFASDDEFSRWVQDKASWVGAESRGSDPVERDTGRAGAGSRSRHGGEAARRGRSRRAA